MVIYDKTYALGANEGSSARTSNQYIILHDTGNANNVGTKSAINEAIYMKRNWQSAYTHAIAGWDKVYIIGEPGYVSYGAGSPANERSPFQIELARYSDRNLALKAYANWINAAREYATKYGIPLTLDGAGNGVKTHKWVSDNLWGNHQDPYAYLAKIGISKAQLASDIAHGVGKAPATHSKPSASYKKSVHDIAVEVIAGKWGNEPNRSAKLKAAGYSPKAVQTEVNKQLKPSAKPAPSKHEASGWIKQNGTFTVTTPSGIIMRSGSASVKSSRLAILPKGSVVKYDAFCYAGGYVWIRQPRRGGYGYLPTGEAAGNKRKNYWGSFK